VPATVGPSPEDIERVFREQHGRAVAVLVRRFGDIDLAEEAVQDAFAAALVATPRRRCWTAGTNRRRRDRCRTTVCA